jgi:hypothetical protein
MMRKMMARSVPDLVNISAKLQAGHQCQSSIGDVVGSLIGSGRPAADCVGCAAS